MHAKTKSTAVAATWMFIAPCLPGDTPKSDSSGQTEYFRIASGPYKPYWQSLKQYQCPNWFRDAKFGIWAHWDPQCVPEQGDWYARRMYIQGDPAYTYHVATYGPAAAFKIAF